MENQVPKIDINIQLGKENNTKQQTLAEVSIRNHSGEAEVAQIKQNAKVGEIGKNIVCLLKYSVYPGRQNQAAKYLQQGLELSINKKQMSPLQYITRKYEEEYAESKIYTEPGFVCVQYRFNFHLKSDEGEQIFAILAQLKEFRKIHIELELKGFVSHSLKNRTNVKVDYAKFNFHSDQIDLPALHNIMVSAEMFPSDIALNPFYATLQKAKKLHLLFKFQSFRQINKYYEELNELLGYGQKKQEKQDFRYVVPGLFRQKVQGYLFIKQDFALSADLTHHGEEIFMRLIKVYFKAAKKAIDG